MKSMDWALLKSVSRSFYLSMVWLPPAMRRGIALGYMLAALPIVWLIPPGQIPPPVFLCCGIWVGPWQGSWLRMKCRS